MTDNEGNTAHNENADKDIVLVQNVSKSFGEAHALRSCSFSARTGEVHAIVGENGSGKSTLVKMLAGVIPPDSGRITVNGQYPLNPRIAKDLGIAVVFQEILVAEGRSILENVFLGHDGLLRATLPLDRKKAEAEGLLRRVTGQTIDIDRNIDEVSLSLRQWVVIARALLQSPALIVFDESTAALDHSSVERFFDVVRDLRRSGACVLIVTHRIHELTTLCDRATVFSDGKDVGELAGPDISEARLLQLMTGEASPRQDPRQGNKAKATTKRNNQQGKLSRPAIKAAGVTLRQYGKPVDLTISTGEILGIAGLEGHGQEEFIEVLTGFRKPKSGGVRVYKGSEGCLIASAREAEEVGIAYIPGDRKVEGVFANLSVFENFGVGCYRANTVLGFIDRRRVLGLFNEQRKRLSIRMDHVGAPIDSLSGGNQQKVVVARSLAKLPQILVLNDPTRGVDIGAKRDLYQLLNELSAQGKTIVFLSNEIEEFEGLCDRVAVFREEEIFSVLVGSEVNSDQILAAMFGYRELDRFNEVRKESG